MLHSVQYQRNIDQSPRRRLAPEQRRDQLLDVGAARFAVTPYEDVLMADVAAEAGVTRRLMYHYFPTKRDFYVAVFRRASDRLLASASPDPQLPLAEQLVAGLQAHIQYFVEHPLEAVTVNRGALSDDPEIQAIMAAELDVVGRRLVDGLTAAGQAPDVAEIAITGWLAFSRAACVRWIQAPTMPRDALVAMCVRALEGALGVSLGGTVETV